jgi:hypothetical protein
MNDMSDRQVLLGRRVADESHADGDASDGTVVKEERHESRRSWCDDLFDCWGGGGGDDSDGGGFDVFDLFDFFDC